MDFEWDENKAVSNYKKHGVTFEEAKTVFGDSFALIIDDPKHSDREARFLIIGYSLRYRVLIVVFVEKTDDHIRIISARPATARERRMYEQGIDN